MHASLDNRHKIALPYWARPGIVSFAKKDDGGGKDDDNDLDDSDDDEDDDDEDDDPDEGKTEDELRAELKTIRDSLKSANGSSAKRRRKVRELQAEIDKLSKPGKSTKSKGDDDDDGEKLDAEAIRAEGKREAEAAAKKVRIADKAELALARANVDPNKLGKAVKLVDLDDLDLHDDGTLDGIDEAIDELKREWPELFAKGRKRKSVAGDHDDESDKKGTKSASELQAQQLTGRKR